jgi:hypothetical protein
MFFIVTFTTTDPYCPDCGADLRRSRAYPHGFDSEGAVYLARICPRQALFFGRAIDGSWSVPVTPLHVT